MRSGKYPLKNLYNLNLSDKALCVTEIGHISFAPGEKMLHSCVPYRQTDILNNQAIYCIHFVTAGIFKWRDGSLLQPGSIFVHTQASDNDISFGECDGSHCEFAFIKVTGYLAKQILKKCNFPTSTSNYINGAFIGKMIINLLYKDNTSCDIDFLLKGIFYTIMSYFRPTPHTLNNDVLPAFSHSDIKNKYVQKAVKYIDEHYSEKILLTDVAAVLHLSPDYITQLFKNSFGCSFQEYLILYRSSMAKTLLSTTDYSVTTIASMVGYADPQHFSQIFKKCIGYTPTIYRKITTKE